MKAIYPLVVALAFASGCATSAHDRRMASDEESDAGKYVLAGLAVLAAGAAAYSSGYNSVNSYAAPSADYDWAWDLQRGAYNNLVWVCRGRQTGQYADQSRCAYKYQGDNTWPGY